MGNEVRYIERGLASLLAQAYPPDGYEILVVEGLSDDHSAAIVRRLVGKHSANRISACERPGRHLTET